MSITQKALPQRLTMIEGRCYTHGDFHMWLQKVELPWTPTVLSLCSCRAQRIGQSEKYNWKNFFNNTYLSWYFFHQILLLICHLPFLTVKDVVSDMDQPFSWTGSYDIKLLLNNPYDILRKKGNHRPDTWRLSWAVVTDKFSWEKVTVSRVQVTVRWWSYQTKTTS